MSPLEISLLIIDLLLWVFLIVAKAVHPERASLSQYELKRRASNKDPEATHELWRQSLLPRVVGMTTVTTIGLSVFVTVLTFVVVGPVLGVLFALLLVVGAEMLRSHPAAKSVASKLYEQNETTLLKFVEQKPWMGSLASMPDQQDMSIESRSELERLITAASGQVVSADEKTMLLSELHFSEKKVADVMTPRSVINGIEDTESIGPLVLDALHRTGHSRFPVYEGNLDHITGMLNLRDLVGLKSSHDMVRDAMDSNVFYVGEGQSLEHALHAFLHTHHHLFIVVNEHRETVGLISLEDIVETLLGRSIVDEFEEFDDIQSVAASNPKANNAQARKKDI